MRAYRALTTLNNLSALNIAVCIQVPIIHIYCAKFKIQQELNLATHLISQFRSYVQIRHPIILQLPTCKVSFNLRGIIKMDNTFIIPNKSFPAISLLQTVLANTTIVLSQGTTI